MPVRRVSPPRRTLSGGGSVGISTDRPADPPEADFALYIDFKKGSANPQRVFQAADAMIRSLQRLDHALCASVDSSIEPVMVLEEIETGSIKVWLSNVLQRIDDDALKQLEWKPVVGRYLVKAKYAFIRWSNKETDGGGLIGLAKELRKIASETDVRHIPDYAPPSIQELAEVSKSVDEAKKFLLPDDKMSFMSKDETPVDFNLSVAWSPEELSDLIVNEKVSFRDMPMTLIVKRPDYLEKSKWDFRHGKAMISAKILDEVWLKAFQAREKDVRPGDALKCLVTIQNNYGFDNELISEDYTITNVQDVVINKLYQENLDI